MSEQTTNELARVNPPAVFTDNDLREIGDWNSALALLERAELQGESYADYGTGFAVADKKTLVGVPLLILEWRFNKGDFGEFVSATAVTKHGTKVIINDGSTGIAAQLRVVTDLRNGKNHPHPQAALYVERGLAESNYVTEIPDKNGVAVPTPATTYYLAE